MTTVTAIGNQKGGVGKTSTTLGLAAALRDLGRRVLVLDLDSQANATATLDAEGEFDLYDVLKADEPGQIGAAIVTTGWEGIDAVPGTRRLAAFEAEALTAPEHRLREAMHGALELERYDDIVMDLPPALGRLTVNGLAVADRVVVVTEPASYSVAAVERFLQTVSEVQRRASLNPQLRVAGLVVNKAHTPLTSEHAFQVGELQAAFKDLVRLPILPRRAAVEDAASAHAPVGALGSDGGRVMAQLYAAHAAWLVDEEVK